MDRTFIIVEPDPVVTMDIVGALKGAYPTNDVKMATTLSEASQLIGATEGRIAIFVNGVVSKVRDNNILNTVAASAAQIIFVGQGIDIGMPATVIEMPFTTDMILNAISNDEPDRPAHQPVIHT